MKKAQYFPFHPFLLGVYSVLALLATNITEVRAQVALRPILIMLLSCAVLLVALRLIWKDWQRAGVVASALVLLFITYGHLYGALEENETFLGILGRHRALLPMYATLFAVSVWWAARRKTPPMAATRALNMIGILLLVPPMFQIISAAATSSRGEREASQWTFSQPMLRPVDPEALPDVYFIVLDSYTRADVLLEDFDYDNSEFIRGLEEMGFYVAEQSNANYDYTQGSLTTALNLDYLPVLKQRMRSVNISSNPWLLMKQSLVRHQLERIGYRSVAFETSYEWSRITDSDIFLGSARSSLGWQQLDPFERMWANSTALMLLNEVDVKLRSGQPVSADAHLFSDHIEKQLFVLETLPEIADNPAPTFTFAHILIPHVPYVFAADGSILNDPGYYGTKWAGPVDETYFIKGYTGEIAFINRQMLSIMGEILSRSERAPIIVLLGDHGVGDNGEGETNRLKILYAAYLPDGADKVMYPTISPVNTFRIIFDQYYGTNYGLLPDTIMTP